MRNFNEETAYRKGALPIWNKLGYGMGEMGAQLSWMLISSYLTVYYTDVVGLTPIAISIIMLVARIWDAMNDPIFGAIAENTQSRWGRFRPYILFGSPLLALFNCLVFLNLPIDRFWKNIWCAVTYILCGMAYTAVGISVGCLANSMTANNKERVSLNAFRGVMGSAASLIVGALTMPLILFFGNGLTSSPRGYLIVAVIYSCISIPLFLICFFASKEEVQVKTQRRGNTTLALFRSFRYTFEDKNARRLILAEFFFLTGVFGRLGIMTYYFIYILKNAKLIAGFAAALSLGMMLANPLAAFLMNRMDKKWVGTISAVFQALCCITFFVIGEYDAGYAIVPIGFLYGVTNMSANVAYGLSAEIIDDNWIRTGVRSDGVIYSCISFSTKMGNAVGGSIGILVLGAVGYVANSNPSALVLTRMNSVINLGPAVFFALSAAFFAVNGMTNQRGVENELFLNKSKNE